MPLVGLIDPSHDERRDDMPGRFPKWLRLEDALQHAHAADPKWSPWTYELLAAAMNEWQERDYISTTSLIAACPRSLVIERHEPYILSLDQLYASLMGTLIHRTLEHSVRDGAVAEARFFTMIDDVQVSCSPDLVTRDTIWDYKKTENVPTFDYPYKKHTLQLQFNRFIVNHASKWEQDGAAFDIPFDPHATIFKHLAVVYLGPKGPKVIEVTSSQDWATPNGKTVKRRLPDIWDDERVYGEISPRLEALRMALESYPKWPKGLEEKVGWEGPADWKCPGAPLCWLPNCTAKRWPNALTW